MRSLLALLLMVTGCQAASPSFSSFNTNQFSTNGLFISIKDGALITNLTVRSSASFPSDTTFGGSTIANLFNTNQFTTNASGIVSFSDQVYSGAYSSKYGLIVTNVFRQNLDSGTNDLFTIPAGYFLVGGNARTSTTNTSSTTSTRYAVTNSIYYALTTGSTVTTNSYANSDTTFSSNYPFLEGETVSIVTTTKGVTANTLFFLVATNQAIRIGKLHSLSAGYNTLLTVSSNKTGISTINAIAGTGNGPIVAYLNASGGSRVVSFHIVPDGVSPSDATVVQRNTVADGISANAFITAINGGASIVVETDASTDTQIAYTTLLEIP